MLLLAQQNNFDSHSSSGCATTRRISLASRNGRGKSAEVGESANAMKYAAKGSNKSTRRIIPPTKTSVDASCDICDC
jgi:hypothetical protein